VVVEVDRSPRRKKNAASILEVAITEKYINHTQHAKLKNKMQKKRRG
jgi:hypothetical protein